MTRSLAGHPLIGLLEELALNPDDFVVHGSGPMLAHGLRDIEELDVIARGSAWRKAIRLGTPTVGTISGAPMYEFAGGLIHVSRHWFLPPADNDQGVDRLIETSQLLDGLRFAPLAAVLAYKQQLNRAKDVEDIKRLTRTLDPPKGPASDHELDASWQTEIDRLLAREEVIQPCGHT